MVDPARKPDVLLSLVIPCYGSERYLRATVRELVEFFAPAWNYEIMLVNDGSPDNVQQVIEELHRENERIRYIELRTNAGQHGATLRGFAETRGQVVVTVDDDGQNPPEAARTVAEALLAHDVDVVYGRFRTKAHHPMRKLASSLNQRLSEIVIGNKTGVKLTNVRAIQGDLARLMGREQIAFPYIDSMIFRATRRVMNVDIDHRSRSDGESTYTFTKLMKLWLAHMTTLSVLPLHLATTSALTVSLLGFLFGVWKMISVLRMNQAPAGWLSLFCALTFLFATQFAFMAVVSLYVGRLYVSQNLGQLRWERSSDQPASRAARLPELTAPPPSP